MIVVPMKVKRLPLYRGRSSFDLLEGLTEPRNQYDLPSSASWARMPVGATLEVTEEREGVWGAWITASPGWLVDANSQLLDRSGRMGELLREAAQPGWLYVRDDGYAEWHSDEFRVGGILSPEQTRW